METTIVDGAQVTITCCDATVGRYRWVEQRRAEYSDWQPVTLNGRDPAFHAHRIVRIPGAMSGRQSLYCPTCRRNPAISWDVTINVLDKLHATGHSVVTLADLEALLRFWGRCRTKR